MFASNSKMGVLVFESASNFCWPSSSLIAFPSFSKGKLLTTGEVGDTVVGSWAPPCSSLSPPFLFLRRMYHSRIEAMKITAKGIATPIPAFAPVERLVDWRPGSTGSDVAVGKYVLTLEV